MNLIKTVLPFVLLAFSSATSAAGNTSNDSFNKAKKMLERAVYQDHRVTIYSGATFDAKKNIKVPLSFVTDKHVKRAKRVEWEYVV
ncbi:hypothetical protein [Shewanella sp. GutCb]|uniref:hypothetical protein n=1 Tax=Shewanella sp. GutCb TaxID=2058315 RepID=UPI0015E06EF8|nr:hypothetical protein [Shewanella sp. GutCb]